MPNQSTTPLGFMDTYAVQVINDTGDEKIACWDIVGPGIGYRFASDTLALKEQWIAAFRSFAPTSRQSVNPSSNLPSATTSGAVDLRAEGMNELVSTEKAYLQNLYSTIELYKNSEDLTDMVGLAETYVLFANIEILSQVNRLLLAMLEKEHKLPPEQNVGRVFLSNLQDLNSMLIKPIQRISKYPLLLRELLKHTPDTHTHYSELKQAVEQIEELLNLLNDKQRDSEALARLARIHSSLIWKDQQPVQLVMPTRKLLRKQKFSRIYREEHINKAAPGLMMLFNDLLIVTKKRGLKRHRCLSAIPLRCLILWEGTTGLAATLC
ncbi:RhoGEF domain containing protein [Acanthamoeba castellanii str. Neff]|uniref:RhoGEF domain containing protein n=1 Tax=Acanthamoeba castellanii (strain ATCC 30010 / Neff) TaxID=1257118 RepID=L8GCR0_ACACF|nr:RhoGEF domain containing protein [Acanthamoeba castellanii str. Neff]ELR10970.1 RhoGEF domain containing protein [Acanthamoeba castellanii str. Neff]